MLTSAETIKVVASSLQEHKVPTIVLDPVSVEYKDNSLVDSSDLSG